jgi:hypothetical protein
VKRTREETNAFLRHRLATDPEYRERRRAYQQKYYKKYGPPTITPKLRARRKALEDWFASLKTGKPCTDCRVVYPYYVMDWDHLSDKKFQLSRIRYCSKERILAEIAKCELVCANCHRIRTWNRRHERRMEGTN